MVGEQFADDDVLLGAGEEFEVAFDAGEEPTGLGSFEQVEGVCGPGAGGGYGEAAVAGCGYGVSHAGCGGAGGCEDEQAGGVVPVGEVAQGAFGEVMGLAGSGDAGEQLSCHGFSLSGGRRVRPAARHVYIRYLKILILRKECLDIKHLIKEDFYQPSYCLSTLDRDSNLDIQILSNNSISYCMI